MEPTDKPNQGWEPASTESRDLSAAPPRIDLNQPDLTLLRIQLRHAVPQAVLSNGAIKQILRWREDHGSFTSFDELQKVRGIGTSALMVLEPLIQIEGAEPLGSLRAPVRNEEERRRERAYRRAEREDDDDVRQLYALPSFQYRFLPDDQALEHFGVERRHIRGPNAADMVTVVRMPAMGILNKDALRGYESLLCGDRWGKTDPLIFFQHLGEIAELRLGRNAIYVPAPSPQSVADAIEAQRLKWFEQLRRGLGTPDEFLKSFTSADSWVAHVRPILPTTGYVNIEMLDEYAASNKKAAAAYFVPLIVCADLFLTYISDKYHIARKSSVGWHHGRMVEIDLLSCRLPPPEKWAAWARETFDFFYVESADYGNFVLPGLVGGVTDEASEGKQRTRNRQRTHDPERLLYSMGLPEYLELRSLRGGNPFEYVAALFTENRAVLDTNRINNRLFCLRGPIAETLELAHRRKGEIVTSPLCQRAIVHDPHGRWREKLKSWLASEAFESPPNENGAEALSSRIEEAASSPLFTRFLGSLRSFWPKFSA